LRNDSNKKNIPSGAGSPERRWSTHPPARCVEGGDVLRTAAVEEGVGVGGVGGGVGRRFKLPMGVSVTDRGPSVPLGPAGRVPASGPLPEGTRGQVAMRDGTPHVAVFLDHRVSKRRRGEEKEAGDATAAGERGWDAFDYYVHYVALNRRMDEWVTVDRVAEASLQVPVPPPGRKDEREGKGKKDERHGGAADPGLPPAKASHKRKVPVVEGEGGRKAARRVGPQESARRAPGGGKENVAPASGAAGEGGGRQVSQRTLDAHAAAEAEHEEFTKVKNVDMISLGKYRVEAWYFSPLPPELHGHECLHLCDYCLTFHVEKRHLERHLAKCPLRGPPGDELYRDDKIAVFELDGEKARIYCQNLCYLSKLFLDHKTLYYDVDLFLFYVVCEHDSRGYHIVGYFSKEKHSEEGYNLACILVLPQYQRKGYGKVLIALSYELSKITGKVGTPERPLSDLGFVSYRSYWSQVLLDLLWDLDPADGDATLSIQELSDRTAIKPEDVVATLQSLDIIRARKDGGGHCIALVKEHLQKHRERYCGPGKPARLDPTRILWVPPALDKT